MTPFIGARARGALLVIGGLLAGAAAGRAMAVWPYAAPSFVEHQRLGAGALAGYFAQAGDDLNDLDGRVAALTAQLDGVWSPVCPPGFARSDDGTITRCARNGDELVRVGSGPEAFWIDRFEASVWSADDGSGSQSGGVDGAGQIAVDYPTTFPRNGQWRPGDALYALSRAGVQPSTGLTWFQANEACRASGKRLATIDEWFAAASGSPAPGASDGGGGSCLTAGRGARSTGMGVACRSFVGAEDMVGNVAEWTDEWYAGPGGRGSVTWSDALYRGDAIRNVLSPPDGGTAEDGLAGVQPGLPAAATRGGAWDDAGGAGPLALSLRLAPTGFQPRVGFRCVIK